MSGSGLLPPNAPRPRLCRLIKRFPNEEYGFNLHAERGNGQFIGKVDPESPADVSGLRQGDHILAVNGAFIGKESHRQVVARIKEDPLQTSLLVLNDAALKWYDQHHIRLMPDMLEDAFASSLHLESEHAPLENGNGGIALNQTNNVPYANNQANSLNGHKHRHDAEMPRPRLCRLVKHSDNEEFGFNLHAEKSKGHFVGKVDRGSIADKAGLREGQRIVGVNGTLIFPNSPHKEVVILIKLYELETTLLVAPPDVDEYYRSRGLEYSFHSAETIGDSLNEDSISSSTSQHAKSSANSSPIAGSSGHQHQRDNSSMVSTSASIHQELAPVPLNHQQRQANAASDNNGVSASPTDEFNAHNDQTAVHQQADIHASQVEYSKSAATKSVPPKQVSPKIDSRKDDSSASNNAISSSPKLRSAATPAKPREDDIAIIPATNGNQAAAVAVEHASPDTSYRVSEISQQPSTSKVHKPTERNDAADGQHGLNDSFGKARQSENVASNRVSIVSSSVSPQPASFRSENQPQKSPSPGNSKVGTVGSNSSQADSNDPSDLDMFNLSAAEVRARLAHRKKKDPKAEPMSLKEKYQIIKNL